MYEILHKYFGYTDFHPLQKEIIDDVLKDQNVLVLMPTGGGKSLCYQLPAIIKTGIVVVISPLISLMKDQVDSLLSIGIQAASINSTLDYKRLAEIKLQLIKNNIKLLYIAPERIMIPDFFDFLHQLNINLIAIDEAHCISEWGHEFRPEYRKLNLLKTHFPNVPLIALTSTAIPQVQNDIINQLNMVNPKIYKASLNRKNLFYQIIPKGKEMYQYLLQYLKNHQDESGIIYCQSRKSVDELSFKLQKDDISALPYHAGLSPDIRKENQEKFIKDDIQVIIATIAFGMGINKSNVRYVIHCDMPKSIEGYYQETGRAGRDGLRSDCILFFSYVDKIKLEYFIKKIENEQYQKIAYRKMWDMINFCTSTKCRRITLINYFGEKYDIHNCNMCDICVPVVNSPSEKPRVMSYHEPEPAISKRKRTIDYSECDHKLFEILRVFRKEIADKEKIPPYIVFSDAALKEITIQYPQNMESFRKITGVGNTKSEKYGNIFLEKIINYCKTENISKLNYLNTLRDAILELVKSNPNVLSLTDTARILIGLDSSRRARRLHLADHQLFGYFPQLSKKQIKEVINNMICSGELKIIYRSDLSGGRQRLGLPVNQNSIKQKAYSVVEIQKKYSSAYEKWTKEDEQKLINEYNNGKTINELSKLLGRQHGGIRSRLKKLNILL